MKQIITTDKAPKAIGPYSQAIKAGNLVYISGQIPIDPLSGKLVTQSIEAQIRQVFANLQAITQASGGDLHNIIKLNLYLTDLRNFDLVNSIMAELFVLPYPARAAVQVAALPKNVDFEAEAVMLLDQTLKII